MLIMLLKSQGREGVGRWNQRAVPKCCTICAYQIRRSTAPYQELEVNTEVKVCHKADRQMQVQVYWFY